MSFVATVAVIAVAGVGVSAYALYQQGEAQEAMAEHNADVAEEEARATQMAIEAESRSLTKGQRKMQAKQRMSIASRGGLAEGTDLMTIAEQAKEMQLDQLELRRQQDIAGIRGTSQAAMSRYQGRIAKRTSRWTAGSTLLQGAGAAASR